MKKKSPSFMKLLLLCVLFAEVPASSAQTLSLIVTEIMFKTSKYMTLPHAEYVELFNKGERQINLSSYKLEIGKTKKILSPLILNPGEYAIVCAKSDSNLFADYGKISCVSSLSLSNSGQKISIFDFMDNCIFTMIYSDKWMDEMKTTGGWSLEMSDVRNPCGEKENWKSSKDESGGTPGKSNSVSEDNQDLENPKLRYVASVDSQMLRMVFSEKMNPDFLKDKNAYYLSGGFKVDSLYEIANDWKSVVWHLNKPLKTKELYNIKILPPVCDCVGNRISDDEFDFAESEKIDSFDIVINEILFNPYEGGEDFVELYNRSEKVLDISELRLSTRKSGGGVDSGKIISSMAFPMPPDTYVLLSKDMEKVCKFYDCEDEEKNVNLEMSSFPVYSNSSGTVIIISKAKIIDCFSYEENMHYPLLASMKGVSLEKVHPDAETQDASHWHSAASAVLYATPGRQNSCYAEFKTLKNKILQPETSIFSPDGDAYFDLWKLHYEMPAAGYRASANIYHSNGKKIRCIMNNELLGSRGLLVWDGIMDNGQKAPIGVYVLIFEYWNLKGELKRIKSVVTLAGIMN